MQNFLLYVNDLSKYNNFCSIKLLVKTLHKCSYAVPWTNIEFHYINKSLFTPASQTGKQQCESIFRFLMSIGCVQVQPLLPSTPLINNERRSTTTTTTSIFFIFLRKLILTFYFYLLALYFCFFYLKNYNNILSCIRKWMNTNKIKGNFIIL